MVNQLPNMKEFLELSIEEMIKIMSEYKKTYQMAAFKAGYTKIFGVSFIADRFNTTFARYYLDYENTVSYDKEGNFRKAFENVFFDAHDIWSDRITFEKKIMGQDLQELKRWWIAMSEEDRIKECKLK